MSIGIILLCGTAGVGKTTLINHIKKEYVSQNLSADKIKD